MCYMDERRVGVRELRQNLRLDAIHLATVLSLAGDVDRLITYDARLAEAASASGVEVAAPGT